MGDQNVSGAAQRAEIVRARVAERADRRFYPEVQALRAIAIGMVLVFHFGSGSRWVSGSLVGVDVFFVISGFLITSHLISEVDQTGTIRLGAFYARRARRLLPASLLVLMLIVPATLFAIPREQWWDVGQALLAAAFYWFNLLGGWKRSVDPGIDLFGLPSIHYWSLSAEEQFYLLWPPLILLAVAVTTRRTRSGARASSPIPAITVALVVVAALSFVISVLWTRQAPGVAFFVTPTRVWEFAAGGLVTLVLRRWAPDRATAVLMRWTGLVLILPGCLLLLLPDVLPGPGVMAALEAFPGPMAMPSIVGTALVILAGAPVPGTVLDRLVRWGPTQWLGLVSYSAYLWHWPVLLFGEVLFPASGVAAVVVRLVCLAVSLFLAHLSQRWVEDATRFVPGMKTSTRMSLWAALAGMTTIAAAGLVLMAAGTA